MRKLACTIYSKSSSICELYKKICSIIAIEMKNLANVVLEKTI